MQIRQRIKTGKAQSPFESDLEKELLSFSTELSTIINKGLRFSDNFNAQIVTVADTGTANTEFSVAHTLKTVPAGFILININNAGIVYDSGTVWTTTALYLKCSAANCTIKIIVLSG